MRRILAVSAHPDDMEIGMGGTVARMLAEGCELVSVVLTDGGRSADPFGLGPTRLAELRKSEAQNAAQLLGIQQIHFFDLPALSDDANNRMAVSRLSEVLSASDFSEMYILHSELDRHPTHRMAGLAAIDAADQAGYAGEIWAYEVWGVFPACDRLVDISAHIGTKMRAIAAHRSQVAVTPYAEGVCGLNRWRAIFSDPQQAAPSAIFAEAFVRIR